MKRKISLIMVFCLLICLLPACGEDDKIKLSDNPTYEEILALHSQDPEKYRDPGELQPECTEMVKLEDGQWYQSFVYTTYNCRCVIWNSQEAEKYGRPYSEIGSAENYFLYNAGVRYDDPSGIARYEERPIAVRGSIGDTNGGYACQLYLPDSLIVCIELPDGGCGFADTETLAIPDEYASILADKNGEIAVTGIVMQDKNGTLYLKDVELFE